MGATHTLEPETPAPDAPEAPPAGDGPSEAMPEVRDASAAYERRVFGTEEEEPEGETAEAPSQPAETPAPSSPPPDDDAAVADLLAKYEKHPRLQDRINRLAANVAGNQLQTKRAEWQREYEADRQRQETEFTEASSYRTQLAEDDAFYEAQVSKHGRAKILRWIADYEDAAQARQAGRQQAAPQVDTEALRNEVAQDFNVRGVQAFAEVVKGQSFYAQLPETLRTKIENGNSDQHAHGWLGDWMDGLGKWFTARESEYARTLEEARTAGRNEAAAAHDDVGPVVTPNGGPGKDPREIVRLWAAGDPSVSRKDYHAATKALGQDY